MAGFGIFWIVVGILQLILAGMQVAGRVPVNSRWSTPRVNLLMGLAFLLAGTDMATTPGAGSHALRWLALLLAGTALYEYWRFARDERAP